MRIRRNASKILGSAAVCAASFPPPPPPPPQAFADCAGILCELNRSPWDVMPMPTDPNHSCCCTVIFTNPKEEDGGILGNNTKKTEVEEPISAAVPSELAMPGTKIKVKERNKIYKNQEETTPASTAGTVSYCRKSNGKGWHCKRLAQLPSAFCTYHLAQIRSYNSNHRHRAGSDTSAAADGGENNHLAKVAAVEEKHASSNHYNFHFGFGPWRGKRRGKATVKAKVAEEVKEDMASKESMNHDDDDDDDNMVASDIAGDDEYDLDEDVDVDDDDNFYRMPLDNDVKGKKEGEMEKRMVPKKRGRKPIKARSLKSLL